ncbi:nitrate- and nitrite sensing domain-containing protein [Streptomyces sp. JJ36]|uniref:nitrate- and nitrite sensing domain-containing protein n=1 Tax=Streptomyces sp. JJ36 TaxID=2736645 RepID=UPI001F45234F|nr:nitrate- and nitrite sensing domain-containing protein [Streptomyces sp. JJ36]MCF6526583.1 nitrate- and nitrite sensing domain-containing protein [Streptomyces sp. JJ36]
MRRRKTGSAPQSGDATRGNFTPPSRTVAVAADAPGAPGASGGRLAVRNWRVPTKLNAILLIPVLVALVFGGFRVKASIDTWSEAEDARHIAELVQAATDYGNALINERDRTAEPLLAGRRDDSRVRELREASDRAKERFDAAVEVMPDKPGLKRRLATFRKAETKLAGLREAAYTDRLSGVQTEEGYVRVQHPLMEFANELGLGTGNVTSYGRTVYAVSLAKAAESLQRSIGMHLLLEPGPSAKAKKQQLTAFASYAYLEEIAVEEYVGGGRPQDLDLLRRELSKAEEEGKRKIAAAKTDAEAQGRSFAAPPAMDKMVTAIASGAEPEQLEARGITPETWFAAATSKFDGYRAVESELTDHAVKETDQIASDAKRDAFVNGGIVVAALLIAFVLAAMMARHMSNSMRALRTAAFDVAEQRLPMLVDQLSRTEPGRVDTRVDAIPIDSRDEIGEVARAFDQVHREAVRLAAEQALLRGNVNAIFTNLSSRNQGLIERQLELITGLENNEADPDQLESLFRLDHLATRMRRNGENLLVLAGEEPGRRWTQPVPLVDTMRAAASEVEHYERIEISGVPDSEIHGAVVTDLVHLLAELLENAATFSSPQTKVHVTATRLPDGRIMIEIHDKGIGLTPEDFADINHKLANPPTVDAEVSKRMGLYVVGRLADRHGIRVQLRPSGEQAGTTSLVMLPEDLTHGGGGDEYVEDDFTVSRIVPEQPQAAAHPGFHGGPRSAAELGFDDSRYDRSSPQQDPVSRSLMRGERRAALGMPDAPERNPGGQPEHGQAPYGGGYEPAYPEPAGGQGDYDSGAGYGPAQGTGHASGYYVPQQQNYAPQSPYQPEAESHPGVPEGPGDRVGFERPGPSSSGFHPTTGAGLPRRNPGRQQPEEGPVTQHQPEAESPSQAPQPPRPAAQASPETSVDQWQSANDDRWQRAGRLRDPQAGGVTESGLPRRVPRANLVEGTAEQSSQGGPQVSRAPEDVRGRLSNLHRGVRRGRNAGDATQNDRQGFGPGSTYDQER